MTLTKPQVKRWLAKWKRALKLQDWEIRAEIYPRQDMGGNDGLFGHTIQKKQALIQLAQTSEDHTLYDPEQTLIHELLHVHFAPFQSNRNGSLEDIAQEQAIDTIANTLIAQAREIEALKAAKKPRKPKRS